MRDLPRLSEWMVFILFLLVLPVWSLASVSSQDARGEETILVGRMAHVEGSVLRYVPEEGDWLQTIKDAPFGLEDKLRSDGNSRAEIILPNNTWVRMGHDTHLQLLSLDNDATVINMIHGVARLYNKGSDTLISIVTPFGTVQAPAHTSFDLYVSETSIKIVPVKGSVTYFSSDADKMGTEVTEGSTSLVADQYKIWAGAGSSDPEWERWNLDRDALWARRMRSGGISVGYLPPRLHDHAYVLDDYGRWERVYCDGAYGYFWRPIYVSPSWTPYSVGSWTHWYGDQVWIPGEPFGYVTHHYGTWAYIGGSWRWAPPVTSFSVHFAHPYWSIGFAWYPGRVGWFHFGVHIGWFPLGPREPYHCYRRWGPRAVVSKRWHRKKAHHRRHYRHSRHAIVVKRGHLYATDNYRDFRIKDRDQSKMVRRSTPGMGFDNRSARRGRNKEQHAFRGVSADRKFHSRLEKGTNREPTKAVMRRNRKSSSMRHERWDSPSSKKTGPDNSLRKKHDFARATGAGQGSSQGRFIDQDSRKDKREPRSRSRASQEGQRRRETQMRPRNVKSPNPVNATAYRTDRKGMRSLPHGSASVSKKRPLSGPMQPVRRIDRERAGQRGKQKRWEARKPPGRANARPTKTWGTTWDNKSWRSPYNAGRRQHGQRFSDSPSRSFSRNHFSNRSRGFLGRGKP